MPAQRKRKSDNLLLKQSLVRLRDSGIREDLLKNLDGSRLQLYWLVIAMWRSVGQCRCFDTAPVVEGASVSLGRNSSARQQEREVKSLKDPSDNVE